MTLRAPTHVIPAPVIPAPVIPAKAGTHLPRLEHAMRSTVVRRGMAGQARHDMAASQAGSDHRCRNRGATL